MVKEVVVDRYSIGYYLSRIPLEVAFGFSISGLISIFLGGMAAALGAVCLGFGYSTDQQLAYFRSDGQLWLGIALMFCVLFIMVALFAWRFYCSNEVRKFYGMGREERRSLEKTIILFYVCMLAVDVCYSYHQHFAESRSIAILIIDPWIPIRMALIGTLCMILVVIIVRLLRRGKTWAT